MRARDKAALARVRCSRHPYSGRKLYKVLARSSWSNTLRSPGVGGAAEAQWVVGKWAEAHPNPILCEWGWHITDNPLPWMAQYCSGDFVVYEVQVRGDHSGCGQKLAYEQVRLLRPARMSDLRRLKHRDLDE